MAQGLGVGLLDRGDQPGRAVGDDQHRAGQAAVLQIGQEGVPGVGGLASARRQADEGGLSAGGDAPGGQHRLGRGAGMHPEEAGVQEQVVHGDGIEAAGGPPLVLVLDLLADRRDRGLGDRGLIPQRLGQGGFHVADGQAAHERGDHQRLQRVGLGDMAAEQPGRERLAGAAQLRPGQRDRPRGGLDGHLPVPVPRPGPGILASRGPLVTVPAQELRHLGLQRGLHQQLGAEPRHLLQNLRQRTIRGEQLIDVVTDTVSRRYSDRHGRGSFPSVTWRFRRETYARPLIYTRSWTPPDGQHHMLTWGCPGPSGLRIL